ncbi:MAG: hypothetical protein QNJ44_03790 [Rhodobacter sp.]|nr:hypothetical protein [Rhodobacter sp.]
MLPLTRSKTGPLTVFVHVPKAAGSTVNRHLQAWSKHGLTHAERFLDRPEKLARRLPRLDWVSGHIALNRFLPLLTSIDRPLRLFGTMRAPAAQVAAQYNWQIEIFHRGRRFYNSHPPGIRAISERIRATDNSDPQAIIANLQSDPGLFLNLQSRFLLGDDIDLAGPDFDTRFAKYETILPNDRMTDLIRAMTGAAPTGTLLKNASPDRYDRTVFDTPALREFLARENSFDQLLFDRISR